MTSSDTAGPGWYADPAGTPGLFRWWDGAAWTDWLADDPQAAPPAVAPSVSADVEVEARPRRAAPEPDEATQPAAEGQVLATLPAPTGRPVAMYPPGYERRSRRPATEEPRPATARGPRIIGAAAVLVAIAVVVAAVIYGNRVPPDPLASPLVTAPADTGSQSPSSSSDPSGSASPASLVYDASSRTVTIGTFSAVLPDDPYRVAGTTPQPLTGVLSSGVGAAAVVQRSYDGEHDWQATMSVGRLDDGVIADGDAGKTARNVLAAYDKVGFPGITLTPGKITTSDLKQPGVTRGAIVQGRMNYRVKGVDSRWDQVSILVVQLADGSWVGWMSSRPEKTSSATMKVLREAINTIKTSS